MTTTSRDLVVTDPKNAHAMENQALSIMKPQAGRIENNSDVEAKLQKHIALTEGRLKRILDSLDEDKSSLKDLALSVAGLRSSWAHNGAIADLEANLNEELAMAEWPDQNIEGVTLKFASLKGAGETAKKCRCGGAQRPVLTWCQYQLATYGSLGVETIVPVWNADDWA